MSRTRFEPLAGTGGFIASVSVADISRAGELREIAMKQRVLVPQPIAPVGLDFLKSRGYEVDTGCGAGEADIIARIGSCSGLLIRNAKVTQAIIDAAPELKVIGRHGVGVETIDVAHATRRGIWVTNAPESNFNAVAEHTIMVILLLAKKFLKTHACFSDGDFDVRNRLVNLELSQKTLGIVGFGRVGRAVARKAHHGLEMKIIAYDPFSSPTADFDYVEFSKALDDVFSRSDFVTLHLPANEKTREIVDRHLFETMKPSAYLVNAARHEIVNEADFVAALQAKRIAGAAVDVYAKEPPDMTSAILRLPNVVYTPHNAAHTAEAFANMALHAAQGIHEILSGSRPTWPVNRIG